MSAIPGELDLLRGRVDSHIALVESGMGKVNAASVTTEVILRHDADVLLFTGVAGGVDPSLSIGDIVIGDVTIQHDAGIRRAGALEVHQAGHLPFMNPTDDLGYRPPRYLLETARDAAESLEFADVLGHTPTVTTGTILTGDQFIDDADTRDRLRREFGASAVEMEGAAVAQVAARLDVSCLVIRALSDLAGSGANMDFGRFVEQVAANSALLAEAIVARLRQPSASGNDADSGETRGTRRNLPC